MPLRIETVETEMTLDGDRAPRERPKATDKEAERRRLQNMVAQAIADELERLERRNG